MWSIDRFQSGTRICGFGTSHVPADNVMQDESKIDFVMHGED
jgi:hypothetical protein